MNKILSTTAVLAAMTAGCAANAQGMSGGWYASVFGGLSLSTNAESDFEFAGAYAYSDFEQEFDPGYILGVTVGMSVTPTIRAEVELSYAKYEGGDLTYSIDGYAGYDTVSDVEEATATYLMANLWFDVPSIGDGTDVVPYVGGGIGGVKLDVDSSDDTVFAYQLGAGVHFPVGAGMIDVGYRLKGIGETELDVVLDSGFGAELDKFEPFSSSVQVSYVMKF